MEVEVGRDGILLETFFANPMLPRDDISSWQVHRYSLVIVITGIEQICYATSIRFD